MVSTRSTRTLKPNEGYGHLDIVTVNMPKGGQMQTSFFGLVDGLTRLYDRRVGRATGSTPIKQFSNEAVAETHAVEQRRDYRIDMYRVSSRLLRACFQRYWVMCYGLRVGKGR